MLLRIAASVFAVAGTRTGEGRTVSGDVLTPLGVDAPPDKGVGAPPDEGVDALPDQGVDALPDQDVEDSSGVIRVARLLLALSSDVTATNKEAMRAFSTGSLSFAIPNVRGVHDWGGWGYDDFVPGEVTKTAPPGIGLHDPLYGRQACSKFIAFDQGVGQICLR